jgi:DnaJ-class molecular chaperone
MPPSIDFDPSIDFYKALGVDSKATADEIKKSYRKLAKQYHPDSTGGDKAKEARFKDVSNAYDVLGDKKKRDLYDQIRAGGGMRQQGFPGGRGGMSGVYSSQGGGPNVFDLNDLFGQFFSGGGMPGGGRVHVENVDGGGPRRGRAGRRGGGRAEVHEPEPVQQLKAADGSLLRVEGRDLHSELRIPWDRAILGTVATVPTFDGKADVKIPPGTSSGRKLRLRGKGVADRNGHTGDHYVTVQIDVPSGELDEETRKQIVLLALRLQKP